MASGITRDITGVLTLTDKYELTAEADILNIINATITLAAPAGDLFTGAGDDVVTIVNSTITASADGLSFFLGSGDDSLSISSSTIDAPVATGSGADTVLITGGAQSTVTLKKRTGAATLSLGDGDDILTLAAILAGAGDIDFGAGNDTLRFDGGSLLTTGALTNLTNLAVTAAGGTLGRDLALTGNTVALTLGGNLTGNTTGRVISIAGGTVTLTTANNVRTNVALTITGAMFILQSGGTLEFSGSSGYILAATRSTVTLHDWVVSGNGGGLSGTDTVWTVRDCNFVNNNNSAASLINGTLDLTNVGIFNHGDSSLNLNGTVLTGNDVSFSGNKAKVALATIGGAICTNADITLINARFTSNYASSYAASASSAASASAYGGAIYQNGDNMTLTSATFSGNYAFVHSNADRHSLSFSFSCGGAIYQNSGNMTLASATFSGNYAFASSFSNYAPNSRASAYGGAIYQNGDNMTLTSATFSGNYTFASSSAADYPTLSRPLSHSCGGAIYQSGSNMTLTSATFSGNYSLAFASSYFNSNNAFSSSFSFAHSSGGAIYQNGGTLALASATFSGNYAFASSSSYYLNYRPDTDSIFRSGSYGGAIYQNGGTLTLTSTTFSGNYASSYFRFNCQVYSSAYSSASASSFSGGGAIYQNGGTLTLISTTFSGNYAYASFTTPFSFSPSSSYGGAIYASSAIMNIQDAVFTSNKAIAQAVTLGGAIYLAGTSLMTYTVTAGNKLSNSANTAGTGGFLYMTTTANSVFDIDSGASLTIGNTANASSVDSIAGSGMISKNGVGTMTIHSDVSGYTGKWTVSGGILHLATIARAIKLEDWTIGVDGILRLSEKNDVVNMSTDKKIGVLDLGGGSDVINTGGYTLSNGELRVNTLTLTGGGRVSSAITIREAGVGFDLTFDNVVLDSSITGGSAIDTIRITKESQLGGAINLGGGDNVITATATATFGKTLIAGNGNNTFSFTNVTFEDTVNLGDGDNKITASALAVFSKSLTMGIGNNTLTFTDVTFKDAVNAGNGNDVISVSGNVTFENSVNLGSGNNSLTVVGVAVFGGQLINRAGDDTLTFTSVTFGNTVNLGDGNNTLTASGAAVFGGQLIGGAGNDTITLSNNATFSGLIDLGGGKNMIGVYGDGVVSEGVKMTAGGETRLVIYRGADLATNTLSVFADEHAARHTVLMDWSSIADLDKVRIVVSSDSTFLTFEFTVELYNQSKFFTLDVEEGYYIQFQAQDEDGWKQRLLPDIVAPDQVTGLRSAGGVIAWDAANDNLGGNGVKLYRIEVSADSNFNTILSSYTTTALSYNLGSLNDGQYYWRIQAEDYTNNKGEWNSKYILLDTSPPTIHITPNKTAPTNQNVVITAAFADNIALTSQQYKIGAGGWQTYSAAITMIANGTVYFKAVDSAGNETLAEYAVANIDKVAPTITGIAQDRTAVTNQNVVVSATFADNVSLAKRQYKIGNGNWLDYTAGVVMTTNGTVYFRAEDSAGNEATAQHFVGNIDRVAPTISNIAVSTEALTRQNVTVTASFADDAALATQQYKIDNGNWQNYTTGVVMTANGTVYFKATDSAGNESLAQCIVSNIDKTAPTINVTANTSAATNQNVTVSATFADNVAVATKLYKIDNGSWLNYTAGVVMTANGTIYFKATDTIGNEVTAQYVVGNIDKIAPTVSSVAANTTVPTNQNVTVTAIFADNIAVASKQYKIGNGSWTTYGNGVVMTVNGTVFFRATDTAGNVSTIAEYVVANIDKIAPTITGITPDSTAPTNRNVTVAAIFADDVALASVQYKIDNGNWAAYISGVTMSANGTIHFKTVDAAGNETTAQYAVTNIDKIAPTIHISPSTTAATNQNVTVAAAFADNVAVATKQYKIDNGSWQNYTAPVIMTANGTVSFRAVDSAGNETSAQYSVSNIDRVAPTIKNIAASTGALTNRDVTVTAVFADNTALASKQYKIGNGSWVTYTAGVTMTANGTVYFRAVDAAGNETTAQHTVSNIDKTAPVIGITPSIAAATIQNVIVSAAFSDNVAVATKQYRIGNGSWLAYTAGVTMTANGTVYFRAVDTAGNEATAQYAVTNIDRVAPTVTVTPNTTIPTNQNVTVTATFADNVAVATKEYKIGNGSWIAYAGGVIMTANGTVYFRAVDTAGNEASAQYTVSNIDRIAPDAPVLSVSSTERTNNPVTVTASFASDVVKKEYSLDGKTWQAYAKAIAVSSNTTIQVRGYDAAGNVSSAEYKITNIVPSDPMGPGAVVLTSKVNKYNVTVSWKAPAANAKIANYEVEYNGRTILIKGTSLSLKNLPVSSGNTVRVRAIDSLGRYGALSEIISFDVKDVTAPTLGKITASIDRYTGTVSWSGTDNVGVVRYVVSCGGQTQTVTTGNAKFENLAVGKHSITVQAFDAAGNASKVGKASIAIKDVTPPKKVTGLSVPVADAKYKALLSWNTGTDNSGKIASYEIQFDNGKILKSNKTTLSVGKLSVGEHTYKVRAIDASKNIGEWSDIQTFTVKDMTAPKTVSAKARVDDNSLLLTWTTPKDNVGVTGYILKYGANLEFTETLAANQLSFRIDGIAKGSCQYQIVAVDAAGNRSKAKSGKAAIKTELPMAVMSLELPDAIPDLVFDSGSAAVAASQVRLDDPLDFCAYLKLESELALSAADLFNQDDPEKRTTPLFASV